MSKRPSKVEPGTPPLVSDTSAEATGDGETIEGEGLEEEQEPQPPSFPPYPPYVLEPAPMCVADHVGHGNEMRREHKSKPPQRVKPYPKMAKPWGCKAGSAPMTRQQLLAHLRCLKRHGVVLTDRLTQISKPSRRTVLSKWRENALILSPEIIVRYRTMLDADDPWSPDQAYQFFLNMRKNRRKTPCQQKKLSKREMQAVCGDKRFAWAREATVAFARGIQERLSKPGCFSLNGGMLRLSDIILEELCGYMSVRVPARCSNSRKARFMMEMSDKIAIWIDDILAESDDRMLMMDFDEDDDMAGFLASDSSGGGDFADNFLNMMGDSFGEKPAFAKFSGDMLEAFKVLNRAMDKKGDATLLTHGKFTQTYKEGSEALRKARDFLATEFDCTVAQMLNVDLAKCVAKDTPKNIKPAMKEMIDICSKYIAQNAEFHKDKGEAFQLLLEALYGKGPCQLYSQGKSRRTYAQAADDLVNAKSLETDSDDPMLTQHISTALNSLMESKTADYLLADMIDTLDICSRYLSKKAVDEDERGPAFDYLIKTLEKNGNKSFTPEYPALALQFAAAYVLKSAPALTPRDPMPDNAMTPVSLHSIDRPKTPPQVARSIPLQTSAHGVPENQTSMKTVPVQTSKDPLPPGQVMSLRSTKSPTAPMAPTGSLKLYSPAPDGGGSLKTMVSPQEMGQPSKEPLLPHPPSVLRTPVAAGSVRTTKSQPDALQPLGSVKSKVVGSVKSMPDATGAAVLKSSHLIATMGPVPESAEIFNEALHHAVDSETPSSMVNDMNEVVDRCSGYLAVFVRDRELTLTLLLEMMYGRNAVVLVERKRIKMTYSDGANEIQQAPFLIPFLPVKDIAVEIKTKLTDDMRELTPYELKNSMQCAIKDAAGYLSQLVALKSGAAGERYNLELLTAIKHTLGARPLYKYKSYGHTYAEGAKTLKWAGPLERGDPAPELRAEIQEELRLGMPLRIAPSVVRDLAVTINDASKHLAHVGKQKALAMQHLTNTMREKGAGDFITVQGLPETYEGGARTIELSPTLHNESVDRPTYDTARQKLTQLAKERPNPEHDPHMPAIIDEASRFLAKPVPQTHADKRAMLARLLAMKGNTVMAQDGIYKMTYKNASEDLPNAKLGQTTALNERLREQILNLMMNVIPDQKTLTLLQDVIFEGSAYLADTITGRAAAIKVISDGLLNQEDKPFLKVGDFDKSHQEVAELIKSAPYLSDKANPTLYSIVSNKLNNLPKEKVSMLGEMYMADATDKVSKHISRIAADEAGMSPSQLAAWNASGGEKQKSLSGLFLKCPLGKEGSFLSKVGSAFGIKRGPSEAKRDGSGHGRPKDGPGGSGGAGGGTGGQGVTGEDGQGGPGSPGAQGGGPGSPRGRPGSPQGGPSGQGGPGVPYGAVAVAGGPGSAFGGPGGGIGGPGSVIGGPGSGIGGPGGGIGGTGSGIGGPGSGIGGPGGGIDGTVSGTGGPRSGIGGPGGGIVGPGSGIGGPGGSIGGPGGSIGGPGSVIGGPGGGIGGPGSGIGGPGSGIKGPGSGIGGPGGGIGGHGGGIGGPRSGIGGPGSGIGGPGSAVERPGGPGSGIGNAGSGIAGPGSGIGGPGTGIGGPGSGIGGAGGPVSEIRGAVGPGGGPGSPTGGPRSGTGGPGSSIGGPGGLASGIGGPGSPRAGVGGPGSFVGGPGSGVAGPGGPGSGIGGPGGPGSGIGGPGSGIGGHPSGIGGPGSGIGGQGGGSFVGRGGSGGGGEGLGRDASAVGRGSPKSAGDLSRAKSKSKSKDSTASSRKGILSSGRFSEASDEELEENERALKILLKSLSRKGGEILYQQPLTTLTHSQAGTWLSMDPPMHIDKSVKHSSDTARLAKKFEKKLGQLVCKPGSTPELIKEPMQDVIIESARILSEYFVSTNYKILARDALITEMQKKGNEILIEVDRAAETFFFAAQRLKRANSFETLEPCNKVSYYISKKLDEMVRCRLMPRKLMGTMKVHAIDASEYLSTQVTKPDTWIEAYMCILNEMENTGSKLLFRGEIPKSYKDSAAYLRGLPSFEDRIKRDDLFLNSAIPLKLMMMMRDAEKKNDSVCNVITVVTRLLVSYIKLQQEHTEVLKYLVTLLDKGKCGIILNHGKLRKTYQEAANLLRKKNADEINQIDQYIDPVVARKVQIKMDNLVKGAVIPLALKDHFEAALEVTTNYLAVELLEPHTIQVCKCMNSVFVQCELWCDEILRKITRPICSCARHAAAQMTDCHSHGPARPSPEPPRPRGTARPLAGDPCPITFKECPAKKCAQGYDAENPCPASLNLATTYLMYNSSFDYLHSLGTVQPLPESDRNGPDATLCVSEESLLPQESQIPPQTVVCARLEAERGPYNAPWLTPRVQTSDSSFHSALTSNGPSSAKSAHSAAVFDNESSPDAAPSASGTSGVVSTDQMADWHALMVSFVWNIQAWRDWLQETLDRGLHYSSMPPAKAEEHWMAFRQRVTTETVQWRHYNVFSRELLVRIVLRYNDKVIISPTRASEKTKEFLACQDEMLQIIDIFNRWTKWIGKTVTETDALKILPSQSESMSERRWNHYKEKVKECSKEWMKYNEHLRLCWEEKYWASIADWLPARHQAGPVWVVSACGAVPSGAVAAGVHGGEVCWLARTTHRSRVMPAALLPARHCAWVYADGAIHHYTKYQVMCNAEVAWVPWRAGSMRAAAVSVAPDVYVGRVLYRGNHLVGAVQAPTYRCHVVIFGRPFAFSCFELLVLAAASTCKSKGSTVSRSA